MAALRTLSFPFTIKEAPDGSTDGPPEAGQPMGIFAGYASTWDKDLYDDVIVRGAFAETLANQYPEGGARIPIHWQHEDGSPFDVIGETLSAIEDDKGLYIEARLDLDTDKGARAYELLKRGLIHQMSIGFLIEECAYIEKEDDEWEYDHREIRRVKLFEISLVQVAGNQAAEITEVKAAPKDTAHQGDPAPIAHKEAPMPETTRNIDAVSLTQGKDSEPMDMASQLTAKKQAAAALVEKGADRLTEEEYDDLNTLNEDITRLESRLAVFKAAADNLATIDNHERKETPMRATTLGDNYIKGLEEKGMSVLDTKSIGFRAAEYKAASSKSTITDHATTDTTGTNGQGYAPLTTQTDPNGVFAYQRPLVIADLFAQGTMEGSSIQYPVYGALEGGAATVKEGATKPKLKLPAPTWVTDTLHEVAAYWKITDQMAEDVPYVVSEINNHAEYDLRLAEEVQLLSGSGTDPEVEGLLTRNIQTMAKADDSDADRIFKAFTKVATATGFKVDAVVLNPADYESIRLSKDSNGQYYGGGPFTPGEQVVPLWGVHTVVTPAIDAGTAIVGAFKQAGTVFRKGGIIVESSNSNEDDFINDKIAFRVKERITLQVKYPQAFVKVTLGLKPAEPTPVQNPHQQNG